MAMIKKMITIIKMTGGTAVISTDKKMITITIMTGRTAVINTDKKTMIMVSIMIEGTAVFSPDDKKQ